MPETICENEYGRYSVPGGLDARPAVRLIKAGKVYEPNTIAFMRAQAGSGDIVHAGTFFGDFLPALSDALAPNAHLWAFEPNPDSFAHAERTIALNDLGNITLTNAALSDRPGHIFFRTHENGEPLGGHSSVVEAPGEGVTRVDAVTLDTVVPGDRDVSIVQLDVEGHECAALLGAQQLLARCRPIVILEDFFQVDWLKDTFPEVGFDRVASVHGNRVFLPTGREV
ncbi:FkbM family methyltransferase [Maritimibacter sp. UBA3975]|uniref:FkbM family methyltransferase n=1 Tax=Maritimibacter sp. UBA3975 TaxID=1946833 RepID=UPI000C0A6DF8|nr:FkbM family methyltransferase [Maritimibacter sp. UBA3975]MAM63494.1 hypothetical protein [Maritimibacter sp.]|tara:strand:+ start:114395 stop:115072 length:678 start_codon:yes stop_codon:yes gene_type:complete